MKDNDSRRKIGIFGSVPVYALPLINSVNEMKALTGVSSFQGANDKAFPSIPVIAERIGLSESATSTAISGLVRKGLVGRKRNYGKSNTYFLLYETESMAQIKLQNKQEKKKERAKRLLENIEIHSKKSQLLEVLEYSKVSNHEHLNSSNIDYSNSSNDILKEQNKRTELKEQKESSLSYLNLKSKFAEKLKSKNIQYFESRKEYGSISLMQELKIEPQEILDMVDILEAVKKNNPNDKFLQGICFTMSHLVSYRANIYNAHNAAKSNVVTFPKYDLEELRKEGFR